MSSSERHAIRVAVGGFSSNAGKTTLMCELLRAFPGWEAIKVTRGHYRSCGNDPHACCVSHMLGDEPVLRSGRRETYREGKDTGRYWDAGALDVHWLIVTDDQVERGIRAALERVRGGGVFIEGNSFLRYVEADFVIIAARIGPRQKIKPSARRALSNASAIYLFDEGAAEVAGDHPEEALTERERFREWCAEAGCDELLRDAPLYTRADLPALIERVREVHAASGASSQVDAIQRV